MCPLRRYFEDLERNTNALPVPLESLYFNYELNRHTWRFIVNKQIALTYERLLYERRLYEIESRRKKMENEAKMLERQLNQVRLERKEFEKNQKEH